MTKLTEYEKETILLTSEGDEAWVIYTFNPDLQRKLAKFSEDFPECCKLKLSTREGEEGCSVYVINKDRVAIQLISPISEER